MPFVNPNAIATPGALVISENVCHRRAQSCNSTAEIIRIMQRTVVGVFKYNGIKYSFISLLCWYYSSLAQESILCCCFIVIETINDTKPLKFVHFISIICTNTHKSSIFREGSKIVSSRMNKTWSNKLDFSEFKHQMMFTLNF